MVVNGSLNEIKRNSKISSETPTSDCPRKSEFSKTMKEEERTIRTKIMILSLITVKKRGPLESYLNEVDFKVYKLNTKNSTVSESIYFCFVLIFRFDTRVKVILKPYLNQTLST